MSDQKKYEQMMGRHAEGQRDRYQQQQLSPEAQRHFSRAALTCEICGKHMSVNPADGTNYVSNEWERKWSIHKPCADNVVNQLDRESRMASERQGRGK